MAPSVEPSGFDSVDSLAALPALTLDNYIAAASEYILHSRDEGMRLKAGQLRLSAALGRVLLDDLQGRLPQLQHGIAGERDVSGALRIVKADVSEIHPLDGLRLAVELKPVLLAVGRAIWNRFGDIRTFAVNLHLKFPFAVVGGVMAIPTWEEDGGVRKDTTGLIGRLVARFMRAGGRETEGDAPHLLEGIGVVVFDPDTAAIHPTLPPPESGLRWDEFINQLVTAYEARFEG